MKITLSAPEINRIVVDYLIETGKLYYSDEPVNVTWHVNQVNLRKSEIVIEQETDD